MKKAIVTGATGFIGRFLVRELIKHNVDVIAVVRENQINKPFASNPDVKVVECNICNYHNLPTLIYERDIDAVFHVAWQGVSDEDAKNEIIQLHNIRYTLELIDAIQKMKIGTFVGCGSIHEAEALIEMKEDKVISNLGYMYKSAKISAHWMSKAKCGDYGIRFFWPLIINAYGEEEKSPRLINTVIRKIFINETPAVSDGKQYYDFVHVQDVAHALYLIAEKGIDGKNYTISSGEARSLKDFLTIVKRIANEVNGNTNISIGFGQMAGSVICLPIETFDNTALYKDTGFKPEVSFEEGIRKTALWIKDNM